MVCFSQRLVVALAASSFAVLGLAGCGAITQPSAALSVASAGIGGRVMGGQQPIADSTVTVWEVGTTDYGSPATQLAQTTTGTDGSFTLGTYSCPAPNTQVYITAAGGDATPGYNNPYILLAAGLGNCSAAQSQQVVINEVTTAAFAYALNNYFSYPLPSDDAVGSDAGNLPGLTLSMDSTIPMLVNEASGTVNPNTATITIEAAKIYSVANTLAACVNSTAADTINCITLFMNTSDTGEGDQPVNTLEAAMQMAYLPYQNVEALYDLGTATAPYVGLSQAPNDWSLGVAYTSPSMGLGIAQTPYSATSASIDIDSSGNVWFPSNLPGAAGIGDFDPSNQTFGGPYLVGGGLVQPQYVAIDSAGLAWVTDVATPTIGYADTTAPTTNVMVATDPSGLYGLGPIAAADQTGDMFFAETDSSGDSGLAFGNSDGNGGSLGAFAYFPTGMVTLGDPSSGLGAYAATSGLMSPCAGELEEEGNPTFSDDNIFTTTGNCTSGGAALATDDSDGLAVTSSLNQVCSALDGCIEPAPLDLPEGIATDGYGQEWVANSGNASVTIFGPNDPSTPYVQISPVAYLHDATHGNTMTAPYAIAVDSAGNVWVANASCVSTTATPCTPTAFQLSELIGAAGPTVTPMVAQGGGEYTGETPAVAGHPTALGHRRRSGSLSPYAGTSPWYHGNARSSAEGSGSRAQFPAGAPLFRF